MIKGFRIRIYPTKKQENLILMHINCSRYIWNYMLNMQKTRCENGEKRLSEFNMINMIAPLRQDKDHEWLKNISSKTLQIVCRDLNNAYECFFEKRSGYPKYRSKKNAIKSYPVRSDALYFSQKYIKVEKIGKVKYKTDIIMPPGKGHKFFNARIKLVNDKWYLSVGVECENQAHVLTEKMGIDLGIKSLATVAYGDEQYTFGNINKSKKVRDIKKRIKHLQRSISRKYETNKVGKKIVKTSNINRQEDKLRKLYARLSNIRKNYIHQTTAFLTKRLLPCRVVMEDLNVLGMMKNRHLSNAIQEQCFHEFIRQMKYKCEWNDIEFVQADKFYPSSKTCSCCGSVKRDLKLNDRIFICPNCGIEIDRDYNAAVNLQRYEA